MGNLTDDMTRLRGEVEALRGARVALMQDLTRGAGDLTMAVAAMRADFTSAHAAMIKQTRGEREAFVAAVISEVNSLLGTFFRNRIDMARKGRHDRGVFLSEMRRQVRGMCKDTADDLIGARFAWCGRGPGKSRPVSMKKEPVVVKPISPPVEAAPEKTAAAPEVEAERSPVTFMEPPKMEEEEKTVAAAEVEVAAPEVEVAAPEVEAERPPIIIMEPPEREEEKETAAESQAPAITPTQDQNLDEKPAKAATKAKRAGKYKPSRSS